MYKACSPVIYLNEAFTLIRSVQKKLFLAKPLNPEMLTKYDITVAYSLEITLFLSRDLYEWMCSSEIEGSKRKKMFKKMAEQDF